MGQFLSLNLEPVVPVGWYNISESLGVKYYHQVRNLDQRLSWSGSGARMKSQSFQFEGLQVV